MADPLLAHDDLELFLTGWFRAALTARPEPVTEGVDVDRVEPPTDTLPKRMLIVRDDGISDVDLMTGVASIGLSVLAGTKQNPSEVKELSRIVRALVPQIPSGDPSNPVAAVNAINGPFLIPEAQPRARAYITVELAVVPRLL